jgi:hypothetical protein
MSGIQHENLKEVNVFFPYYYALQTWVVMLACYQDELFLKPPRIQLAPRSRVNQSGVHIGTPKILQKLLNPITDDFVYHVQGRRKTVRSSSLQQLTLRQSSVHACFSGC